MDLERPDLPFPLPKLWGFKDLEDWVAVSSSASSIRSLTFTEERIMPHCTKRLPLASGRVLTVPFKPKEMTLTESPFFSFFGSNFGALCFGGVFKERRSFFSSIFLRRFWRLVSSCLISVPALALLKLEMVSSATSLASCRILRAFSLASRKMRSFAWSIFSFFAFNCCSKVLMRSL